MLNIIPAFLTASRCYAAGKTFAITGLMLHSIGCPQPDALRIIESENSSDAKAAVHAVIDGNQDYTVYQSLPWDMRGWHAGGSANNHYIGVEMAEPACIKYTSGSIFTCSDVPAARIVATRTYNTAVQLFAELCIQYNLDPLAPGVIISHAKGYEMGIASNHGDPEHLWTQLGMDYTMDGFRADVKAAMDLMQVTGTDTYGSYMVRITAPNTVGIYNFDNGYPDLRGYVEEAGTYTIVDEKGGWGKLKSGAGWIFLSECEKTGEASYTEESVAAEESVEVEEHAATENDTAIEEPEKTENSAPSWDGTGLENITMFNEPLNIEEGVPVDVTDDTPAETPTVAVEDTPAEAPTVPVDDTPAETSTDAVEDAPAEAPAVHVEDTPAEVPTVAVEDIPTEAPAAAVEDTPAEVPAAAVEDTPAETPAAAVEDTPAETPAETTEEYSTKQYPVKTAPYEVILL